MKPHLLLDLATLVADPARIENVPPEAVPDLLGSLEAVRARLWARLNATRSLPHPNRPRAATVAVTGF